MDIEPMRPAGLPDYANPPLDEVVMGIQFHPPAGYQQIFAGDVWRLFRSDFPWVQDMPALAPQFETFGLPQVGTFNLQIGHGVTHDRFWFLSADQTELLQFQSDRLLHNWRKFGDRKNLYPRFEYILQKFKEEASVLSGYFSEIFQADLSINQCEMTYINQISSDDLSDLKQPDAWLNFITPGNFAPDDFSCVMRRAVTGSDGKPFARLYCEAASAITRDGRPIITLNLTLRGAPKTPKISGALEFLTDAREILGREFANLTTDHAHLLWERLR